MNESIHEKMEAIRCLTEILINISGLSEEDSKTLKSKIIDIAKEL